MSQVKAGRIVIDVQAGTAQMIADLERGKNKLNELGEHTRRLRGELGKGFNTRFAILGAKDLLEGRIGNTLAEGFNELASVGSVAFAGIAGGIAATGFAVYEFIKHQKEAAEAPQRTAVAFRDMTDAIRISNDELRVTDDRLKNDIAKLQGKPQNTLAIMLDEAKLAADKLAQSLDKDFDNLEKLLKERNVSWFRRFMGEAGTGDLQEMARTLQFDISDITHKGAQDLHKATDEKSKDAAQTALDDTLRKRYANALADLDKQIAGAESNSRDQIKRRFITTTDDITGRPKQIEISPVVVRGSDQRERLIQLREFRAQLEAEQDAIQGRQDVARDRAEKERLEAAKEGAEAQRPYQDKLRLLQGEIAAAEAKSAAAGGDIAGKQKAAADAEAAKVLAELNNELGRHHQRLTAAQEAKVRGLILTKELATVDGEWKNKLSQLNSTISDRTRGQNLLNESIGKGYEAAKRAHVEMQLMQELGEKYNDKGWMSSHDTQVAGLRARIGQSYDATQNEQTSSALYKLSEQIRLEVAMAQAQGQGAEAVHRAELAHRLEEIAKTNNADSTRKLTAAELALYAAKRANRSSENLSNLNLEIDATRRLAAVQIQGAEATRRAELELKYEKMHREGASPDEIRRTRTLDEAEHQKQVTAEALKTGMAYQNQLEAIAMQIQALERLRAQQGDSLAIEISLKNLEIERAHVMSEQSQVMGTAMEGMRAYFREMAANAKSTAHDMHEALSQSIEGINDNLSKAIAGQKTSWASFFQQTSQHIAKMGLERAEAGIAGLVFGREDGQRRPWDEKPGGVLAKLGGIFGSVAGKRDGSSAASALYVTMIGGGLPGTGGVSLPIPSGDGFGDDVGGGGFWKTLGSLFGKFGGFRAEGGPVDPGSAYMVGEREPELFTPPAAGNITPVSKLGGNTILYNIDARGTDPALTEQRTRAAIIAAHNSAINKSFRASEEHVKRTPQTTR